MKINEFDLTDLGHYSTYVQCSFVLELGGKITIITTHTGISVPHIYRRFTQNKVFC